MTVFHGETERPYNIKKWGFFSLMNKMRYLLCDILYNYLKKNIYDTIFFKLKLPNCIIFFYNLKHTKHNYILCKTLFRWKLIKSHLIYIIYTLNNVFKIYLSYIYNLFFKHNNLPSGSFLWSATQFICF